VRKQNSGDQLKHLIVPLNNQSRRCGLSAPRSLFAFVL